MISGSPLMFRSRCQCEVEASLRGREVGGPVNSTTHTQEQKVVSLNYSLGGVNDSLLSAASRGAD